MYQTDFDLYFAKRIGDRLPARFLSIFSFVLLLTFMMIVFLGTYDYPALQPHVHQVIRQRFQSLILEQEKRSKPDTDRRVSRRELSAAARDRMQSRKKKIEDKGVLADLTKQPSPYASLPEPDEAEIDVSSIGIQELTYVPVGHFEKNKRNRRHINYDALAIDNLLRDPFNYQIHRQASLALDIPATLTGSEKRYGYRDQNEVLSVLYSKQSIIQNCFKKALRSNRISRGAIKVEFEIDPRGFVIPSSVRILDSTLRNRLVEQCIKKNISRWRSFARLEQDLPSHVVHKFIFN